MLGKADRLLSAKTGLLHRSASEQSDCTHGTGDAGYSRPVMHDCDEATIELLQSGAF